MISSLVLLAPPAAAVAEEGPPDKAILSLRFDDGLLGQYLYGYPILRQYDIPATLYMPTANVGHVGNVNLDQLLEMQAAGWEIGSHTHSHKTLTLLTEEELRYELSTSKAWLNANGFPARSLAYTGGSYNETVQRVALEYYDVAQGVTGSMRSYSYYEMPFNNGTIHAKDTGNSPVSTITSWIDQAIEQKHWLTIYTHNVTAEGKLYDGNSPQDLAAICAYIRQQVDAGKLEVMTVIDAWDAMQGYTMSKASRGASGNGPQITSYHQDHRISAENPLGSSIYGEVMPHNVIVAWDGSSTRNGNAHNIADTSGSRDGQIAVGCGLTIGGLVGLRGGATYLDGMDDAITFANLPVVSSGTMRIVMDVSPNDTANQQILDGRARPTINIGADDLIYVGCQGASGMYHASGTATTKHHISYDQTLDVVYSWDATSYSLYINGKLIETKNAGCTIPPLDGALLIGAFYHRTTQSPQIVVHEAFLLDTRISDEQVQTWHDDTFGASVTQLDEYAYVLSADQPVTWNLDTNADWLTIDNGTLSGTPRKAGIYTVNVTASNLDGYAWEEWQIIVESAAPMTIAMDGVYTAFSIMIVCAVIGGLFTMIGRMKF